MGLKVVMYHLIDYVLTQPAYLSPIFDTRNPIWKSKYLEHELLDRVQVTVNRAHRVKYFPQIRRFSGHLIKTGIQQKPMAKTMATGKAWSELKSNVPAALIYLFVQSGVWRAQSQADFSHLPGTAIPNSANTSALCSPKVGGD